MVQGGLGWGAELWQPVTEHPAYDRTIAGLAEAQGGTGLPPTEVNARWALCNGLLREVIHAAGAIAYTVSKIEALAEAAQESFDHDFPHAGSGRSIEPPTEMWAASHEIDNAYIEYVNLVTWMRALADRISHKRTGGEGGGHKLGLLPALAIDHRLKRQVSNLYARLARILAAERLLANYGLHVSSIPHAHRPVPVIAEGRLVIPIPDSPDEPVYVFADFRFNTGRDLVTFAREVLAAVETFMDGLLAAFEAEAVDRETWEPEPTGLTPRRARTAGSSSG